MSEPLRDFTETLIALKTAYEAKNRETAIGAFESLYAKARKVIDWRLLRIQMQEANDKRLVHRRERQEARDLQKSIIKNTSPDDLIQGAFGKDYEAIKAFCNGN
jgi:hypothetical protein